MVSLESLIGKVDFDRVSHHVDEWGSLTGSPSATAAYPMHSSAWNSKAEMHLRTVVQEGSGKGNGGVPAVYPTRYTEVAWASCR